MSVNQEPVPSSFFWRRIHSLTGFFLVLFIIEHLLTNSQAALFLGEDGKGFVDTVNWIHSLPYLPVIELSILGAPFLIHALWGLHYLFTSKQNSYGNSGKDPYLPQYPRNHFYTWQRITSWILVAGVVLHVGQMRFAYYPTEAKVGSETYYIVKVPEERGIFTVAKRLDVELLNKRQVEEKIRSASAPLAVKDPSSISYLVEEQKKKQQMHLAKALSSWNIQEQQLAAISADFGTAILLNVRTVMMSFWMRILYTIFVSAAVFHAFNGLWTFLITWGITLTERSQQLFGYFTSALMIGFGFLGFAAIWLTALVNLRT